MLDEQSNRGVESNAHALWTRKEERSDGPVMSSLTAWRDGRRGAAG